MTTNSALLTDTYTSVHVGGSSARSPLIRVTVLIAQGLGAVIGLAIGYFTAWFENLWMGGAIATFPGFLMGLPVQVRARAEAIDENRVMVRRMGLVALVLTLAGIAMPWWWHAG
jgi:hypothetical protein